MKRNELYRLIPFGMASGLVLTSIVQTELRTAYANEQGQEIAYSVVETVKYGGAALAIVLTLVVLQKEYWKYAFTLVALLASVSAIGFDNTRFLFNAGGLKIEIMSLAILIGHLVLNPDVFDPLKPLFKTIPVSEEMERARYETSVNAIEAQFKDKSTDELKKIIEQNASVPHAIEAARRLLERR